MEHFYVTLPSESSGYYFPSNTVANFKTKLATPIELKRNEWEVGLFEIFYPKGCKKPFLLNTLRLYSEEISLAVKHYESVYDLTQLPYFWEPYKKDKFNSTFSEYINEYEPYNKSSDKLIKSCIGENCIRMRDNVESHFPNRVYNGLEDLAETITNHANYHSTRVNVSVKESCDFASPELVYVYTLLSQI